MKKKFEQILFLKGKGLFLNENLIQIKNYDYLTQNALRSESHFFNTSKDWELMYIFHCLTMSTT